MRTTPPSADDVAIIEQEQRLLANVLEALREAPVKRRRGRPPSGRLATLRDELRVATPSDLPALRDQLHQERSMAARPASAELPDFAVPYFAHMRIEIGAA